MSFGTQGARRAVLAVGALAIGALIAGCSGGSNSTTPTISQNNPSSAAGVQGGERELARVTVPLGMHVATVNLHTHAMALLGRPSFKIPWTGKPNNGSCPTDPQCLVYHGGPVLFNTGAINVYVNPSQTGGGFPNTCTVANCPPAQWGFPGGFLGRYSNNAEMGHILDQYEMPPGPNRNNRFPYIGYITMTDSMITANNTKAGAVSDARITAELTTAQAAVGLTGDRFMYHLFYVQNQWLCSANVGGCYSPGDNLDFSFCAFHGNQTISGHDNIFSVEPWQQVSGCTAPTDTIQNDTSSTLSHEWTEALTDPHLDAWFNSSGSEIGDICRFNYSTISMMPGPIVYNIQEEWINSVGACAYGP